MNQTAVVILLASTATAFGAGYQFGVGERDADVAAAHAKAAQAYATKVTQSVNGQAQKNDQVVTRLSNALDGNEKTRKKVSDAARNTTVYRYCLDSNTLRVLNGELGFTVLPATAATPQATVGTDETDAGIATDADVTDWITKTAAQYQDCRARLDAWAEWSKELEGEEDAGN